MLQALPPTVAHHNHGDADAYDHGKGDADDDDGDIMISNASMIKVQSIDILWKDGDR